MRPNYSFSSRRTRTIDHHNKHRKAFPALAREVIRISDVLLYILDARFIDETRNPDLERAMRAKKKIVITVFNKSDLVNISQIKKDKELSELEPYVFVSSKNFLGRKRLRDKIKIEVKRLRSKNAIVSDAIAGEIAEQEEAPEEALKTHRRTVGTTQWMKLTRKAHIGVIGYPNTGKSSVINMLTHAGSVGASAQAGFTKGIQKVKFGKDVLILDTPGVIEEGQSAQNMKDVKNQAKVGARTYSSVKEPEFVVAEILKDHHNEIDSFYGIESKGDVEVLIEELGKKRKFFLKGGVIDTDRAARAVLKDWQSGKISEASKNKKF